MIKPCLHAGIAARQCSKAILARVELLAGDIMGLGELGDSEALKLVKPPTAGRNFMGSLTMS